MLAARGIILTLLGGLTLILVAALLIGLFDYAAAPTLVRIIVSVLVWGSVIAGGVYFLLPAMRKRSLVQTAMDVEAAARLGHARAPSPAPSSWRPRPTRASPAPRTSSAT